MDYIDEYFNKISKAEMKDIKNEFINFCKFIISLQEKGELSISQASYNICGACSKFFDNLMPEFEDIMNIVCDLELPTEHRDRSLDDWDKLKEIIDKYR